MFRWTHSNSGVVSAMSRASTARIRTSCVPYVKHRDLKHVRVVTALDPHVADQVPEKRRFLRPNKIRQKDVRQNSVVAIMSKLNGRNLI